MKSSRVPAGPNCHRQDRKADSVEGIRDSIATVTGSDSRVPWKPKSLSGKRKTPMNALSKWHPFRELEDIQDRVLRALRLGQPVEGQQSLVVADWSPSVDISEDEKEYLIKAELPEVKKEDVKVSVENGVVSIRGERKFEKEEKNKKFHRVERSYGSFQRSFSLPEDADAAKVTAEYKDGLLQVRLGKNEAKQPRQVEVKVD